MKLTEVEKNWKEHVHDVQNERLQLNFVVDLQRDPGSDDSFHIMIREENANGSRSKVYSTQDVGEALRKYLEEEI